MNEGDRKDDRVAMRLVWSTGADRSVPLLRNDDRTYATVPCRTKPATAGDCPWPCQDVYRMSSKPRERAPTARDALAIVIGAGLRLRENRTEGPPTTIQTHLRADADEDAIVAAVLDYIAVLERNRERLLARTKRSVSIITLGTGRSTNVFMPCSTAGCPYRMRRGRELCVRCWQEREYRQRKAAT